ncbi:hypothetical protein [Clostridium cellulovorans]|uniref:Uncharacterized protein n=1 Tax=Clostridium cellulovorans (strain ATCC 35296 / DSM 3052 / OCM 3 / 743B) TaxID=573061 RepID=D9ST18_CLOC7|nr:hypothetical protein [Clostridium cellulovorans]ADL52680.1 hypothetical protein Clocel_2988 [Clostridium cellulovorans 743B]
MKKLKVFGIVGAMTVAVLSVLVEKDRKKKTEEIITEEAIEEE